MHALFDTQQCYPAKQEELAEQLGLNVEEYTSNFRVASGANVRIVGWLCSCALPWPLWKMVSKSSMELLIICPFKEQMSLIQEEGIFINIA